MIRIESFFEELEKIGALPPPIPAAALRPKSMSGVFEGIRRSSGEAGKAMVPKARPMTVKFVGGKMVKVPLQPGL